MDYDPYRDVFVIRRPFSAKKPVNYTKTHKIHEIPCHPEFKPMLEAMPKIFGPFFFVNPKGRLAGGHYQHEYLAQLWREARACSERKHSHVRGPEALFLFSVHK